ncbi:ClbS/DfsB family four-helix bundle protein [Vibrio variabilis]|uniref:ClbS/DfsB family four-helix bundle protein n=1 Tax=Vibrio variabilis TaxID=990271 RepID=UPI000DDACBD8|nr:ClbS/DfsB family four-helix bundle protein [Vibrio variabilis]
MSSVPKNKNELEQAINSIFHKLLMDYRQIPEELSREIGVEGNVKGTLISVCDTVAYLIGWGQLVLKWHSLKTQGKHVDFPESGYKWNELGLLAESFHRKYQDWSYEALLTELESTTEQVLLLISNSSDDELYGVAWYEKWTLGRMIQFNTSSPMKNMRTKVRRFSREFT